MGSIYYKEEIYNRAIELIDGQKLIFIQDVIDYLPVSTSTFYAYFPAQSEEMETLRKHINENRINIKVNLRKKWYNSDNATLQMALYKLTANDEEHRKLQQNYTDSTTKGDKIQLSETEAISRIKELESLLSDDKR